MTRLKTWIMAAMVAVAAGPAEAERIGTDKLAGSVEIGHLETYEPGYGSVVTVGILESTTERLLERLQVALIIRDADGEELGREGAQVPLLAPGGWGTFRLVFKESDYPEWDSVEPLVWRARAHPGERAPALEAAVETETAGPRGSSYVHEVLGTVTSTDDQPLEWVAVDAAFYDADGRLVAVGTDSLGPKLPPGEEASFKIGINTAGGDVARTKVRGHARPVER